MGNSPPPLLPNETLLTKSVAFDPRTPIPVMVTEHTKDNDEDGQPEKSLSRNATFFS